MKPFEAKPFEPCCTFDHMYTDKQGISHIKRVAMNFPASGALWRRGEVDGPKLFTSTLSLQGNVGGKWAVKVGDSFLIYSSYRGERM